MSQVWKQAGSIVRNRWILVVPGLSLLLAAEVFLRRTLEHSERYLYSFLPFWYPAGEQLVFSTTYPKWRWLLPIEEFGGAWSGALIVTHLVELQIGVPNTWYLFNCLLILASFVTSWLVFRSMAFSYTVALCLGFSTHLYHTYTVPGTVGSPLFMIYLEVVLLCLYKVIVGDGRRGWWWAGLLASTIVTALAYEGWLDLLAFAWIAAPALAALQWHHGEVGRARRIVGVTAMLTAIGIAYIVIKLSYGYGQGVGSESDIVLNYHLWAPMVEDVVSNVLTQLFMTATNFLPPMFVSSTALLQNGADGMVRLQHGYHAPFLYLVPMHYLYFWRYAAGALALAVAYVLVSRFRAEWTRPGRDNIAVIVFMLLMVMSGSTHALVKIRPMKVAPVMGYHVMLGVIGVSLLVAYGVMVVWRDRRSVVRAVAVTAAVWGLIIYSALARPVMLSHLAAQVGFGEAIYPNPMATLMQLMGRTPAPVEGLREYRLTRYVAAPIPPAPVVSAPTPAAPAPVPTAPVPAAPPVAFGPRLETLPTAAPESKEWTAGAAVTITPAAGGFTVAGNDSDGGYQVSSPYIAVPPNHRVLVRVQGRMQQGYACLGILSRSQRWLVPPAVGRSEISFDTRNADAMMLVFINCGKDVGLAGPVAFQVDSLSYAVLQNLAQQE